MRPARCFRRESGRIINVCLGFYQKTWGLLVLVVDFGQFWKIADTPSPRPNFSKTSNSPEFQNLTNLGFLKFLIFGNLKIWKLGGGGVGGGGGSAIFQNCPKSRTSTSNSQVFLENLKIGKVILPDPRWKQCPGRIFRWIPPKDREKHHKNAFPVGFHRYFPKFPFGIFLKNVEKSSKFYIKTSKTHENWCF